LHHVTIYDAVVNANWPIG